MNSRFRADLAEFLREFVAAHRGLRLGSAFGRPAAYAGRRIFAMVDEDALRCRLPPDIAMREVKGRRADRVEPSAGGPRRATNAWVAYRPADRAAMARLAPTLEIAARYVAEQRR